MASFQRKSISKGQTVADKLKKARLEQGLSLFDIQQKTKVQIKYLELLENGEYQLLPGEVYTRTWIKMYAQILELPVGELLTDYKLEKSVNGKTYHDRVKKKINWLKFLNPHFLKRAAVGLAVLIFLGYLAWEINNIVAPPSIVIIEPDNNSKTTVNNIDIIGQTESEVMLMINNELIMLDEQGNFSKNITLSVGLNNLQISAKKKHSRTQVVEWAILRESVE